MIYLKAFVVGGLICTLVQIFLDNTKLMPGRVMVLLVIAGVILGAAGLYEPLINGQAVVQVSRCLDLDITCQKE